MTVIKRFLDFLRILKTFFDMILNEFANLEKCYETFKKLFNNLLVQYFDFCET